jgi:anti-sigma factor RsiW
MRELTPAQLVRMHADGELSPDEAALLAAQVKQDSILRAGIEFEESLRSRVSAVMRAQAPAAPGDLADRVRAALGAVEPVSDAASHHDQKRDARRSSAGWLTRWLADPRRANLAAVAATLVVVVGAVLFGIFGPRLDDLGFGEPTPADAVTAVAQFAVDEHGRCARRGADLALQSAESVEHELSSVLGAPVSVFNLEPQGYRFVGGEQCPDDVCGLPTGHVMYQRRPGSTGPAMLSLFILPECSRFSRGHCGAKECGEWQVARGCRKKVLLRVDGPLRYFLVCCDDSDLVPLATRLEEQIAMQRERSGSPQAPPGG